MYTKYKKHVTSPVPKVISFPTLFLCFAYCYRIHIADASVPSLLIMDTNCQHVSHE